MQITPCIVNSMYARVNVCINPISMYYNLCAHFCVCVFLYVYVNLKSHY